MLYTTTAYGNKCYHLYIYASIQTESRLKVQTFPGASVLNISELPSSACNYLPSAIIFQGELRLFSNSTLKLHQPFL